jgi:hypothetical protein
MESFFLRSFINEKLTVENVLKERQKQPARGAPELVFSPIIH